MPELPEVETTRLGMLPLLHQTVEQVVIRNASLRWPIPAELPELISGRELLKLTRRAKYILAHFEHGVLLLHLGMSGRLSLLVENIPPEKHDHFDIAFTSGQVLRLRDPRRFGAVMWVSGDITQYTLLSKLGPEPLENEFSANYLYQQLTKKKVAIKLAVMDSHLVVGVGNIYASESLFRARINPETPANRLTLAQCDDLVREIKTTLVDALKAGGSSLRDFFGADGNPGYFQQSYFVYGRTGEPCRECCSPILSIRQGQRSTFYCPVCQHISQHSTS
jgi:formamidopyrimidine-DNA glycosylase